MWNTVDKFIENTNLLKSILAELKEIKELLANPPTIVTFDDVHKRAMERVYGNKFEGFEYVDESD